jgi:hypothetical protein
VHVFLFLVTLRYLLVAELHPLIVRLRPVPLQRRSSAHYSLLRCTLSNCPPQVQSRESEAVFLFFFLFSACSEAYSSDPIPSRRTTRRHYRPTHQSLKQSTHRLPQYPTRPVLHQSAARAAHERIRVPRRCTHRSVAQHSGEDSIR